MSLRFVVAHGVHRRGLYAHAHTLRVFIFAVVMFDVRSERMFFFLLPCIRIVVLCHYLFHN